MLRCQECDTEFERPATRGPTPKFCSGACRQANFRRRHPDRGHLWRHRGSNNRRLVTRPYRELFRGAI